MAEPTFPLITGFKGLNNKLDPTAAGSQWLLQAENVLCDNGNYLTRRPGYASFFVNVTDMFGTLDERLFVVTSTNTLYEVYSDGSYRQRATGFVGGPFQWAELGYAVFAMSETAAWCIYPDRVVAWGISTLPSPTVGVSYGTFAAGTYLIAAILVAPDGRLGGSVGVASLELNGSQGIVAHSPPVAGYSTYLYLSTPDGTELYQAATLPGDGLITISAPVAEGPRLETLHCYPPPKGSCISRHGNRMVVAVWEPEYDRTVLYWSKPDAPHWFELDKDYAILAGRPAVLAPVLNDLFVGTDKALHSVDAGGNILGLAGFGAIPNTLVHLDDERITLWTDKGLITFPPLTLVTDAALSPDNRTLATMGVFDYKGSRYVATAMRGNVRQKAQKSPFTSLSVVVNAPLAANARVTSTASGTVSS